MNEEIKVVHEQLNDYIIKSSRFMIKSLQNQAYMIQLLEDIRSSIPTVGNNANQIKKILMPIMNHPAVKDNPLVNGLIEGLEEELKPGSGE